MKVHGRLEMLRIAITASPFLHGRNLGIQAFSYCVGNPVCKAGQDILQVPANQLGGLDNWLETAVGRPEVPALPVRPGPVFGLVVPQRAQRLPGITLGGLVDSQLGLELLHGQFGDGLLHFFHRFHGIKARLYPGPTPWCLGQFTDKSGRIAFMQLSTCEPRFCGSIAPQGFF